MRSLTPFARPALLTLLLTATLTVSAQPSKKKAKTAKDVAPPAAYTAPSSAEVDKRVEAVLAGLTLEEKVGQMAQITLDVIGNGQERYASNEPFAVDPVKLKRAVGEYHVGSVLNSANNRARPPQEWMTTIRQIQDAAGQSRAKVPVLYGIDAIHGATYTAGATMFPQQIAQAATRNRALVRRAGEITAYETRASATPWTFSPVLDLCPDPRFPRQWETFGEDPYVVAELGTQLVKGFEGEKNDVGHPEHVVACIKHFLGYQQTVSGKDRTPAILSPDAFADNHVPPFAAGVAAGAHSVMVNSGLINGVPTHANRELLTGLLKEKLGFKGLVVTDWGDIDNLYKRDHFAADEKDALRMVINAGVDMAMIPYQYESFCEKLVALVKEGKVPQSRVDDAVRRILRVKTELALFERPVTDPKNYPKFGSAEFGRAAYDAAAEAITLLKNDGNTLPLKKTAKVLVTGPNANSMRTLNGGWTYSWQGEKVEDFAGAYHTILEGIQQEIGAANVTYVPGVSYKMKPDAKYYDEATDKLEEAVAAARNADVIVLCLGENSYTEKPGDLNDLYLSDLQTQLAQRLTATGKPVVLVLNEGRPRIISRFEQPVKAIVQTYLPGNYGADALADILFGDVNPSGSLPYTYPRYPNSLVPYLHKYSEEQKKAEGVYNYEADYNPQFAFGHGLSYTTFQYSNLLLDTKSLAKTGTLTVKIDVTNTGPREGKHAVHMYTADLVATQVAPDVRRLRRFEKISLKPGEKQTITFTLPARELSYAGPTGQPVLEAGEFDVLVGGQTARFTLGE
ncbi:MAG: glycoside hydrolase family 3 C-terminal domain-containing protein [Hymenobacteraceae bacterium]|nr:glycoside hydrolase family 3 C-terminal domain-containing protein [Hymenobacteraceae bacterium]